MITIVLGSPRTGTTMIARILITLGIHMGTCFQDGYSHEDVEFFALNRRILHLAGGDEWHLPSLESIMAVKQEVATEIRRLVERHRPPVWGWKVPATSLTLPLFLPYLKNAKFLCTTRDVYASAKSFSRFLPDDFFPTFDDWVDLVKEWNRGLAENIERCNIDPLMLPYEKILASPGCYVDRIVTFLELHPSAVQISEAERIVDPALDHEGSDSH